MSGGNGNDTIVGAQDDALIAGDAGTDELQIGANFDDTTNTQITGIEHVLVTAGGLQVDLTSQTEAFTIDGSAGSDSIQSGQGNDTIFGNDGDDSLDGGAGADQVFGGSGNDTIVGVQNDVVMDGGNGVDTLEIDATFDDTGDAQINAIELVNITTAGGIAVTLDNQTEAFTINGGAGGDTITGGGGNDTINGLGGNDSLVGGGGNDSLTGGAGNDTLVGGAGSDAYVVDSGTDTIDNIDWNPGLGDTLTVSSGATAYIPGSAAADTTDVSSASNSGTIFIESFDGNDTIIGSNGVDSILSGSGNDSITAGSGADFIDGGLGNESVNAGPGNDTIQFTDDFFGDTRGINANDTVDGGTGSDTLNVANLNVNWADGVTNVEIINWTNDNGAADDLTTIDALVAAGQTITFNLIETGAGSDTTIIASAETNGHIVVNGGAQNDSVVGGAIADTLNGGAGNDTLRGGAGNDSLNGGEGSDSLEGGAGADTINLNEVVSAADAVKLTPLGAGATNTAANADTIIGFNVTNDVIQVGKGNAMQTISSPFGGIDLDNPFATNFGAVEIASTVGTVSDLTAVAADGDVEALIAFAIANAKPAGSTFAAGNNLVVVLYNAAGDAGIYNVDVATLDGDLGTADFTVDLIAIVQGVGLNNIVDANLG